MAISNKYNLIKRLGEGGFGEVWLAKDSTTGQQVALKLYKITNKGHLELVREYNQVFGLNSDHLIKAFHVDRDEAHGISYLVMEYCPYGSVEELIGEMDENELWRCIHDIAAGLVDLSNHTIYDAKLGHDIPAPIIHQDLKPANILIRKHDKEGHNVYAIADFGISKTTVSQKSGSTLFSSAGTLAYMAPERFSQKYKPIVESDIWSLGAMLYELVEGRPPFPNIEGLSGGNWLNQKGTQLPKIENGRISNILCGVIYSCLSKDIHKRPTAEKLLEYANKELTVSHSDNNDASDNTQEINHSTRPRFPMRDFLRRLDWESILKRRPTKKTAIIVGGIIVFVVILIISGALIRSNGITKPVENRLISDIDENKNCFMALSECIDSICPSEVGVLSDNVYFYKKGNKVFFIDSTGENIANGAAFDTFNIISNVIVTGVIKEDSTEDEKPPIDVGKKTSGKETLGKDGKSKKKVIRKYGIISLNGKELLACENEEIRHPVVGVHTFKKDTLWGWVSDSSIVLSNSFRSIEYAGINNLLLCKTINSGCWEFWDNRGTKKLPIDSNTKYYEAGVFTNGYAWVKTTKKNARIFIDRNGDKVWSPVDDGYNDCMSFYESYAVVVKGEGKLKKEGLIDKNFNEVLPCNYEDINIHDVGNNAAEVKQNGQWIIVSFDGKKLAGLDDSYYASVKGDFFYVKKGNNKYKLYTSNNPLPKEYSNVYLYSSWGLAEVYSGESYYLVTPKGSISRPYDFICYDEDSKLFRVRGLNDKYGLVDLNLQILVECKYVSLGYHLRSGMIYAKLDSLYGYISKTGEWKLQPVYEGANDFVDGYAIVKQKGKYGLINTHGIYIIFNEYDNIERRGDGLFVVCKEGKYGVFDIKKNAMVVPCKYYNDFKYITHNRFPIFDGVRWGIFTSDGRSTLNYTNNSNSTVHPEL